MARYIDADLIEYKNVVYPIFDFSTGMVHTKHLEGEYAKYEDIEAIPSADVQEVKHAKWIRLGGGDWCCSCCGFVRHTEGSWKRPTEKYCPNCGAKMDGDNR